MRPRKAEVDAMVALLDRDEAVMVEDLAGEALRLAWDLADARTRMAVIIDQAGVGVTVHGLFDTPAQAQKYLAGFPFAGPGRARVLVTRMYSSPDGGE